MWDALGNVDPKSKIFFFLEREDGDEVTLMMKRLMIATAIVCIVGIVGFLLNGTIYNISYDGVDNWLPCSGPDNEFAWRWCL